MRKIFLIIFMLGWLTLLSLFVHHSLQLEIPEGEDEFVFYFKERGSDLKYLVADCIHRAKESIDVASFGLNDKDIVRALESKNIPIQVMFDTKENNLLPRSDHIRQFPYIKSGLMHRKLVAIDHSLLLLGSTNLTPLALKIHKNLVVCVRSPNLYSAIFENRHLVKETFSFFPLPESNELAFKTLINAIDHAKERIFVCIYTFTHQKLAHALIDAKKRGIDVRVYIDRGMGTGMGKEIVSLLIEHGVQTQLHLGLGLLHHKCALIDQTFVFGSANWTKAAFSKNEEYLLFLNTLSPKQLKQVESFFANIV